MLKLVAFLFFKGMTGALAPFSYLVVQYLTVLENVLTQSTLGQYLQHLIFFVTYKWAQ
jgi:hypothetical protein